MSSAPHGAPRPRHSAGRGRLARPHGIAAARRPGLTPALQGPRLRPQGTGGRPGLGQRLFRLPSASGGGGRADS